MTGVYNLFMDNIPVACTGSFSCIICPASDFLDVPSIEDGIRRNVIINDHSLMKYIKFHKPTYVFCKIEEEIIAGFTLLKVTYWETDFEHLIRQLKNEIR